MVLGFFLGRIHLRFLIPTDPLLFHRRLWVGQLRSLHRLLRLQFLIAIGTCQTNLVVSLVIRVSRLSLRSLYFYRADCLPLDPHKTFLEGHHRLPSLNVVVGNILE